VSHILKAGYGDTTASRARLRNTEPVVRVFTLQSEEKYPGMRE